MAEKSGIGWTHHTFNPWWGCEKVSEECRYCYIGAIMKRAGIKHPFAGPRRTKTWEIPLRWNRKAQDASIRRRVFTCSMSDFFHAEADAWRRDIWKLIRECEALDWLILTKRSERITECLPADWGMAGYSNVWLGVTCGHPQSYYRIADLLKIPARVKFISAEPLLGSLDLHHYLSGIDWVITGCEQAAKGTRRPMDLGWVRDINQQCLETNTAHYFKQYYDQERGTPLTNGLIDGVVCQNFPPPTIVEV
ncbi:DUF5131 family protein [Bythopirellula goksoeyrii]|uniref:Phage protein Gp37/Gp68 n=1 Tax=Bythopirellula goksoeyrii TaxID=1400387 RepID=A0A5B9QF33_9BACT|nr:DUF5131 family protein [Bythopirellula goksoeyrii]QEG36225.1 Phage protein Gp37/Gp68 [Bythopirellula goksoeyrii]